jgi:2-keto-4-pentenoate hydratase/2-oxohepta-3-ene-1,7-dioic acid hydratase in catechol pathway
MRLVTYHRRAGGPEKLEFLGVLAGSAVIDLHAVAADAPATMLELLRAGSDGLRRVRDLVTYAERDSSALIGLDDVELIAPLPRPNSFRDFMLVEEHVRNSFGEVPPEWYEIPVYWKGNCDTIFGPEATIAWPHYTDKLDYELEVGAVLGRRAFRVSPQEAADCIVGYTILNDWSARDIQFREMKVGLGPGLGKDFATSIGPSIVTADAIDIAAAPMQARVNGEIWSEGTLGAMRFSFAEVISHLSQEQPLQPGDLLGSGTVGRGCGLEIDRWIAPGDVVELEVQGIGVLRNVVGEKTMAPEERPPRTVTA